MTTTPHSNNNGNAVTLREVYALVKEVRADLTIEIERAVSGFNDKLHEHNQEHVAHEGKHAKHDEEHLREETERRAVEAHRSSMLRWAVSSILTGIGVLAAIIIPLIR